MTRRATREPANGIEEQSPAGFGFRGKRRFGGSERPARCPKVIVGFAIPFKLATYATTAVKSARDNVVPNAGIAVPGNPRITVFVI